MKRFVVAMIVLASLGCHRGAVETQARTDCPNPYRLSANAKAASLPGAPAPTASGLATIVGFVADSTSGTGLDGAVVRLTALATRDSAWARTDSAGRFAFTALRPGRYRAWAGTANFRVMRDTIDLQPGVDTLRVVLERGLPLCNVRMTEGAGR